MTDTVPPVDPDDPFGDKAALDAKRAAKRKAALPDDLVEETHAPGGGVTRRLRVVPEGADLDPVFVQTARFDEARRALLDVTTPAKVSEASRTLGDAAHKLRGFKWEPGDLGLPPHCPVRALGKRGPLLYFQNPIDELVEVSASKLSQQGEIDNLFAPDLGYLWGLYGVPSKQGELRIKYEDVRRDLISACGRVASRSGVFDPSEKVRGRGAWRTDEGVLILHLGDRLLVNGDEKPLGEWGGFIYPREKTLPGPLREDEAEVQALLASVLARFGEAPGDLRSPGRAILTALQTWHFNRGDKSAWLDARLELGWLVCVFLGAALKWRPQTFVVGDAGTGKTTLQEWRKAVCGPRLLDVVDPSSAGIYQTLGRASIGVSIDEFENEGEDAAESRSGQVLKLARYASSGARVVRGGQDGVPSNYEARGVFGFSGINMPALKPQEASRMAILMLHQQADAKARAPTLTDAEGAALGRGLLARICDRWPEWPAVLAAWRLVILDAGQPARVADQFGTLLAAAHMACHDAAPLPHQVEEVAQLLGKYQLAETSASKPNWERCVDHLLGAHPEAWRGNRYRSVGEYLAAFLANKDFPKRDGETAIQTARGTLAQTGMALVYRQDSDLSVRAWLAVPTGHSQVAALFRGSTWSSRAGGAAGTWATALQLAPRDVAESKPAKIDGRSLQCIQLRLDKIIAGDDPATGPAEAN